jgi:hypothetical protein
MHTRASVLLLVAIATAAPAVARAQSTTPDTVPTRALPARCVAPKPMAPVSDSARSAARALADRAQAASIVGDNAAAAALYQQAAELDPADPGIAYALGRGYEAAGDTRAMTEYCRFLALSPNAPEAPDVRQRIAELALALPPDTTVVRVPVSLAPHMPAPAAALVTGLIIPGMGQFMTHQPIGGVLAMAAAGAGIWYGLQTKSGTKVITNTGTDPFGNPYTYPTTVKTTERPNVAIGIGAAGAVGLIAAIQAFVHARSGQSGQSGRNAASASQASLAPSSRDGLTLSTFPVVAPHHGGFGVGFTIR